MTETGQREQDVSPICVRNEERSMRQTCLRQTFDCFTGNANKWASSQWRSSWYGLVIKSKWWWCECEWILCEEVAVFEWGRTTTISRSSEASIAQTFGGPSRRSRGSADVLGISHDVTCWKPLKQIELTRRELLPLEIPPNGSPVKRKANIGFNVGESSEDLLGDSRRTDVMRSNFGPSDRTVTSVGSMSTDFDLYNVDAMVGWCGPFVQAGPFRVLVGLASFDMPPLEELIAIILVNLQIIW